MTLKFTLSRDDFETLLLMAGYAVGAAVKDRERRLAVRFLRLTNTINKDNPNYIPYEVPENDDEMVWPQVRRSRVR